MVQHLMDDVLVDAQVVGGDGGHRVTCGIEIKTGDANELSDLFAEIELEDTRPWYIKVLDVVFFYSTDSWQ